MSQRFSADDVEIIMSLAHNLTGTKVTSEQHGVIVQNVATRMNEVGCRDLESYLRHLDSHDEELAYLFSAVTIHTTGLFREASAFERLEQILAERQRLGRGHAPFRVLSVACSTGEEVYSLATVLENFKSMHPEFEYEIEGWDIDPVSLGVARQGIYEARSLERIPMKFRNYLHRMGRIECGKFAVGSQLKSRCHFRNANVLQAPRDSLLYDYIICRNMLIYFEASDVAKILADLQARMTPDGHLCIGVSEAYGIAATSLIAVGQATYRVRAPPAGRQAMPKTQGLRPNLILFGASTGGTEVLIKILAAMPVDSPPIIVIQHIASDFAKDFATRLAKLSGLPLGVMEDGELILPGHLYIPWGDYHVGVRESEGQLRLLINKGELINSHRPSVDYLFKTACATHRRIFAALLTGMGRDGAQGLLDLRNQGAETLAQSEETCAVYGMPKAAVGINAAMHSCSPQEIRALLNERLTKK